LPLLSAVMATTRTHSLASRASIALALASLVPAAVQARSVNSVPPLPAPSGTVVTVSTEAQLQSAVSHVASNQTIVIAPGTYTLSNTLYFNGNFSNVTVRGATNNRDDVVLVGQGSKFELWDEARWVEETAQIVAFPAGGLPPELDGFSL